MEILNNIKKISIDNTFLEPFSPNKLYNVVMTLVS